MKGAAKITFQKCSKNIRKLMHQLYKHPKERFVMGHEVKAK